jgi:hypothetical protein
MNPETLLLRQIHPSFMPNQQLSSQAFFVFPKDENLLSVYDGDQISAAASFEHYTGVLGFESVAVYGVSVAEVTQLELQARPDPLENFVQHAVIEFSADQKQARKLAKKLRDFAAARDCLFAPSKP